MDEKIIELLKEMHEDIKGIKIQQQEDHIILKALEYNLNITNAEVEKISNDVIHIKGNVEALRKDISNVEVITASNWSDLAKLKAVK